MQIKQIFAWTILILCLGFNCMNNAQEITKVSTHVPTPIIANLNTLDAKELEALYYLVKAGTIMDQIYFRQVYSKNPEVWQALQKYTGEDKKSLEAKFQIHFGAFDRLQNDRPFFGENTKPLGAAFYPENMTKEEFLDFVKKHPELKENFESPYTVIIRNESGELQATPYPEFYAKFVKEAAKYLESAANVTENPGLKKYFLSRAQDLLSNDYFQSDCDWLDLKDNHLEFVIGPYEVYEDSLFNYKAAYEAFIYMIDSVETEKVQAFIHYLKDMQNNLPVDKKYLSETLATLSPLKVVDLVFSAGDAKAGVHTIAFALPNDEKVRELKGSKKIIMQNVMEAKYKSILFPIAQIMIDPSQLEHINFKAFLYHVILHELSHPLGTDYIDPQSEKIPVRKSLKELYSIIEEAKADTVGLYNSLLMMEKKVIPSELQKAMFVTQLASMFRSMRFGVEEAHGGANLIQINFLKEYGAIVEKDGYYSINFEKIVPGLKILVKEILEIEGTGDYDRAKALIEKYGKLNDNLQQKLLKLKTIPIDIQPIFQSIRDIGTKFQDKNLNKDRYLD